MRRLISRLIVSVVNIILVATTITFQQLQEVYKLLERVPVRLTYHMSNIHAGGSQIRDGDSESKDHVRDDLRNRTLRFISLSVGRYEA